jgi:two-component system response regulator FixJ
VPTGPGPIMVAAMKQHLTIHVVDGDMRSRAEQARTVFALGHHAEVYDELDELLKRPPESGVLLVRQRALEPDLAELFDRLGERGMWLPVIVSSAEPEVERVVDAVKQGALDYLLLPFDPTRLARSLVTVEREAAAHGAARRRLNYARARVQMLSRREREVLEWLAEGSSNKVIARELEISPRTVEIHRANMMTKMGARHAAEAVRLWLEAGLEPTIEPPKHGDETVFPIADERRARLLRELDEDELEAARIRRGALPL